MKAACVARLKGALALSLAAALCSAAGCTYLRGRGRDALDMVDVGMTFTKKPQFGIYGNCPFMAPGGYSKVDGHYAGIGGGKVGVMEHHQDAAGLLVWGRENVDWRDPSAEGAGSGETYQVHPLGLATDSDGRPTYKPQCAHYLHLGYVGVTGNLKYKEWPDFLLGWVGIDICGDDHRGRAEEAPAQHARRGDRHIDRGELVAAIWEYGQAVDGGTPEPDAAFGQACALRAMGDERAAERALAQAAGAGSLEARALLMMQRDACDLGIARQLADKHPEAGWAWSLYGDCLLRASRPDDAALAYERALRLGLDAVLAHNVRYNLTIALVRHGQCHEAARWFNDYRIHLNRPLDHDDRYLAGLLAYAQGDHAAALAAWRALPPGLRSRIRQTVGDERHYAGL